MFRYFQRCTSPQLASDSFPSPLHKRNKSKHKRRKDPILSSLCVKVVKATQLGTVIKPRPREQQTLVKARKVTAKVIEILFPGSIINRVLHYLYDLEVK